MQWRLRRVKEHMVRDKLTGNLSLTWCRESDRGEHQVNFRTRPACMRFDTELVI